MNILKGLAERAIRLAGPNATNELLRSLLRDYEQLTYRRLSSLGFQPATIFDIGAYHGKWAQAARAIFPKSKIVMVEAQPRLRRQLERVVTQIGNATLHSCLLGPDEQESVAFYVMGTGSSINPERSNAPREVMHLPSQTLDQIWHLEQVVREPVFVKLDVQGAELDVLRGASEAMRSVEWFQLECALLNYNDGAPQLTEVCNTMATFGFFPTEITGFSRPKDHLVQVDVLFAREKSALRPERFEF